MMTKAMLEEVRARLQAITDIKNGKRKKKKATVQDPQPGSPYFEENPKPEKLE